MTKIDALLDTLYKEKVVVIYNDFSYMTMEKDAVAVAEVKVDATLTTSEKLEQAFMLTNSIDDAWWNNKEITKLFEGSYARSTMNGDMVIVGDEKFKVEPMGWKKM